MRNTLCVCTFVLAFCSVAGAEAVFNDYATWVAATSGFRPFNGTPAVVPFAGGGFVADDVTLIFPDNHGDIEIYSDGWNGDVHDVGNDPGDNEPHENVALFARPIRAFAALVSVGQDFDPNLDSIRVRFGNAGTQHQLFQSEYSYASPRFFGWIGDSPVDRLTVTSGFASHFYAMRDVQYAVVPLPGAAWGGMALMCGLGAIKLRRAHNCA